MTSPVFLATPQSTPVATSKREISENALLAQSRSREVEIWGGGDDFLVIKRGGKEIKVPEPEAAESTAINGAELSADGELGIFTVFRKGALEGEVSGAWLFRTKDGTILSDSVGKCEWAGFTPIKSRCSQSVMGASIFGTFDTMRKTARLSKRPGDRFPKPT